MLKSHTTLTAERTLISPFCYPWVFLTSAYTERYRFSHFLLANAGINVHQLLNDLDAIQLDKALEPVAPLYSTDIEVGTGLPKFTLVFHVMMRLLNFIRRVF
jgi:hypothetical protein